jgi:hypothetical protein
MNDHEQAGQFMTECVDFWFDGPGDTTVRPTPDYLLDHAKAERARILAAEEDLKQPPQDSKAP